MLYALTGATGFVGGALARRLRHDGHEVHALVRDPATAQSLSALGVELVSGDLDDTVALDRLCTGVDGVFHVAGWYKLGQRDPSVGTRVNVAGTRNVLAAAQRSEVPRVVYTSTLAVNSDTHGEVYDETHRHTGGFVSHYDRTKAEAHRVAEDFVTEGLPVVIVQPGLVYGPGDTAQTGALIAQVVRGRRPQVPAGGGACWAHVDDIAAGHVLAMERGTPGESYMLAGPRATLAEGLRQLASVSGTKGPRVLPDAFVRGVAAVAGGVGRVVPLPAGFAAETLRASLATYYGTPAKAERALGWRARSLDTGLRQTVGALRG
jgi:nucleoside-diphosphate-sugar epimerase